MIQDFYTKVLQISERELVEKLSNLTEIKHLEKGELLIREGETQTHLYFLLNGLLRGYFLDMNGRDITDCFGAQRGSPAVPCLTVDAPASINIEALENSDMISLPAAQVMELMESHPCLIKIYNQYLQTSLEYHWQIKSAVYQYTAMQRYQWFLKTYPGLISRVKKKYIASFLRITPVTLSRLRKELRDNPNTELKQQGGNDNG